MISQFKTLATTPRLILRHKHLGRARGVMVIVVGNGYDEKSSNPGRD